MTKQISIPYVGTAQAKTTTLHGIDKNEYLIDCPCDECAGGCDEMNPTCGECFLCEAKADDDMWWSVNRADVLQI